MRPEIRLPDCSKLAINQKNDSDVIICCHDVTVIFWCCFVCLFKYSYWSKFHVNIITGSRVMTNFYYKGLTRNPEIGNTTVWVLSNIWRLVRVRHTKFSKNVSNEMLLNPEKCKNVSNEMLLNPEKCQSYSFYRFWVKLP